MFGGLRLFVFWCIILIVLVVVYFRFLGSLVNSNEKFIDCREKMR